MTGAGSRGRRRRRRRRAAPRRRAGSRTAAARTAARAGAHDPGRAADERAVDEDALERLLAEAAEPGERAGRRAASISSSKYHLLANRRCRRGEALAHPRPTVPGRRTQIVVGERDAGERRARRRARRPSDVQPVARRRTRVRSSPRTSARGTCRATSVVPNGICSDAAERRRRPRAAPIADLHRARALGDVVLGPGEADVGVLVLAGRRVACGLGVVEVALLELARLGHRLAPEGAEDHPPRVDRGQERADVAGDVEDPVPAAALADARQDLVLGEEARERRDAGQREAADDEAAEGERHRLAEAAHAVERTARRAIAAISEPAAMNSSALKKACVIRWNRPAA